MSINFRINKKVIIALSLILVTAISVYGYILYTDSQLTKEQETIAEKQEKLSRSDFQKIQLTAQKGNAAGLFNLSNCYFYGQYVEENKQKAFEYMKLSADKKYPKGLAELGAFYYHGIGTIIDYTAAIDCWNEAVKRGNFQSNLLLAQAYYKGHGVKKDIKKAVGLYESTIPKINSAEQKAETFATLADIYSKDSIVMDKNKAFNYIQAATELDKRHETALAYYYLNGIGTSTDAPKAISIYKKYADKGDNLSMHNLAVCYSTGNGVNYNLQKAEYYYTLAANKGYADSQCGLGFLYYLQGNYRKAVKWYIKSAEQGNPIAQYNLGMSFLYGRGIKQDFSTGKEWIKKAADARVPEAKKVYKEITK